MPKPLQELHAIAEYIALDNPAAVYGLHVQRMAQDEVNAVFFTQIGDPVPAVHAFDTDDKVITKEFERG